MILARGTSAWQCPLYRLGRVGDSPFTSYRAVNDGVARYKSLNSTAAQRSHANQLYLRHLPMVRKALARFCPRSECRPGGCLVEELVGETYPIFRKVLDDYEPSAGLDFLGYASQRLRWRLEHQARRLERALFRTPPPEAAQPPDPRSSTEDSLLDRVLAEELLARLDARDADIMVGCAAGYSSLELAESAGTSDAALRKRVERLRAQLREVAGSARTSAGAPNGR